MRYVSLFSGIEAASVAWQRLGWIPVAFSEIEAFPKAVLAARYPHVPDLGDITKIDWSKYDLGTIDLVAGGSPCQSFSIAGKREGLQGESGLMFEYIRAVRELRPKWVVWENVPGALSCERGNAFRQLLSEMDDLGYGLAWRVLDAQFYGVAQRRRRIFLIGSLGSKCAAQVLFERDSLSWDPSSSREKRKALTGRSQESSGSSSSPAVTMYEIAGNIIGRQPQHGGHGLGVSNPDETGAFTLTATDRHALWCAADSGAHGEIDKDMSPTLTAHISKGANFVAPVTSLDQCGDEGVRRLTPLECERLQGFPDGWTDIPYKDKEHAPDHSRYKALGNSMAVPVMRWIGEGIQRAEDVMW